MNGKHPIDDLFARTLRDAEATPPPAVWEGIVRERGRGRHNTAKRRSRWGLAALVLLLLGFAGYWTLASQEDPSSAANHASPPSSSGSEQLVTDAHIEETSGVDDPQKANTASAQVPQVGQLVDGREQGEASAANSSSEPGSAQTDAGEEQATKVNPKTNTNHPKGSATALGTTATASAASAKASRSTRDANAAARAAETGSSVAEPGADALSNPEQGEGAGSSIPGTDGAVQLGELGTAQHASSEQASRLSPDVHLATLTGLVTPLTASPATAPGPILKGDSTPAYVLGKGLWWFALQGEWAMLNGEWKGTSREVPELNESETWQNGQGLSLVVGRQWLSGWSVGLGVGANKQRSRFLRREVESGHSETVVDTTWTGTAMGAQTNYTWDIVETQVTEPGVEHDYSATNSYTRLRIAPEISYQLLQKKRFSLQARLAPLMMFDIGRKGNTIVPVSSTDSSETMTHTTVVIPLSDAAVDERFPMTFAISGGLDLRYRICERWSVSALPTFTYWIPRAEGTVPSLSMNELGGALRLRYDLRHQERRVK